MLKSTPWLEKGHLVHIDIGTSTSLSTSGQFVISHLRLLNSNIRFCIFYHLKDIAIHIQYILRVIYLGTILVC